jgi:hypothetical protein
LDEKTDVVITRERVRNSATQWQARKTSEDTENSDENVRCQNIQNQLQGQDNAGTVVGNQPAG